MQSMLRRIAPPVFLGALPLFMLVLVVYGEYASNDVAIDFHNVFYPAAQDVLDGVSPYVEAADPLTAYVYTPLLAFLVTPFTVLPLAVAEVVASLILMACFVSTPYVIGVRDWRVVGAMLLWPPFVSGLQTANVTFLLCFLCALTWRWRDRRLRPGFAIGMAIALKLVLWPVAVWLLVSRRLASFFAASLMAVVAVLLVLPFDTLGAFVGMLREHGELFDGESYTVYAFLAGLGMPDLAARAVWLGMGLGLLGFGRRNFILCIAASLALSPIVWLHYFALLVIPLAVAAAPLWVWLLPVLLWFAPGMANGDSWHQALVLGVATLTIWLCVGPPAWMQRRSRRHEVEFRLSRT